MPFDDETDDSTLVCVTCGSEFVFTSKEKQTFASRQWTPPKRCLGCRSKKRAEMRRWDDLRKKRE